jgi:hypothetical protein
VAAKRAVESESEEEEESEDEPPPRQRQRQQQAQAPPATAAATRNGGRKQPAAAAPKKKAGPSFDYEFGGPWGALGIIVGLPVVVLGLYFYCPNQGCVYACHE